jgi:peptidoglycan/xylan/chitin deacetylase (PgdA/CDA1 family)
MALRRLQRAARGRLGLILTYHHVSETTTGTPPLSELERGISKAAFREQVEFLSSKFELMTVSDLVKRVTSAHNSAQLPLAVSFDDGYRSVHSRAWPMLVTASSPATVYVPSGYVNTSRRYWWIVLSDYCASATPELAAKLAGKLREQQADEELISLLEKPQLQTAQQRFFWRGRLALRIDKLGEERRSAIMQVVEDTIEQPATDEQTLVLTNSQLEELTAAGWEIGAHTVNHVELTTVDEKLAGDEISADKLALESTLGHEIRGLAYPYGRFNPDISALAEQNNFKYAVATRPGTVSSSSNRYALPRLSVARWLIVNDRRHSPIRW